MTIADVHCPSCGHFIFRADIDAPLADTSRPLGRLGRGTEVAAALLEDFFREQTRFVRTNYGRVLQSSLIEGFNTWAIERGSTPQSASAIGRGLRELGVEPIRSNGERFYGGVGLANATS